MENYYKLLGVPQDADIYLIKSSFRKKAKTCHPDLFCNSSEKEQKIQQKNFVRLSQAYETLADPKKRMIFDSYLKDTITDTQQTSDQKKNRSSSFSSEKNNLNKKAKFYKESNKSKSSETEDTLENLVDDLKKIMDQFGAPFKDPLEILVQWGLNIFNEINESNDKNFKNKKNEYDQKYNSKKSAETSGETFNNLEDELDRLKKLVKSRSRYSNSNEYKNFENEIDQELRSIKKKYRI